MKPVGLVGTKHASGEITEPGTGPRPDFLAQKATPTASATAALSKGDRAAPDGAADAECELARPWDAEEPEPPEHEASALDDGDQRDHADDDAQDADGAPADDDEVTPAAPTGYGHVANAEDFAGGDELAPESHENYAHEADTDDAIARSSRGSHELHEAMGGTRESRAVEASVSEVPLVLIVMLIAALGGATALVLLLLRHPAPEAQLGPSVSVAASAPASPAKPAEAPRKPATEPEPEPADEHAAKSQPSEQSAAPTAAPKGVPPSPREIAHMEKIRALFDHNKGAAYRMIYSTPRAWRTSTLAEEREGLAALALFSLAPRARARANAVRFMARHPQSPLRPRLEQLLAEHR